MADKFGQRVTLRPADAGEMWRIMGEASKAVPRQDPTSRPELLPDRPWDLMAQSRGWKRATLKELRAVADDVELTKYAVVWSYYGEDAQWNMTGQTFDDGGVAFELSAYAGTDRLRVEEIVRDVAAALRKRGFEPKVHPSTVNSTDDGRETKPKPLAPRRRQPLSARISESVKAHAAAYVIGVAASVTATAIVVWLGISGP
jgi:hypothetical protein